MIKSIKTIQSTDKEKYKVEEGPGRNPYQKDLA